MTRKSLFAFGLLVLVAIPGSAISLCDYRSPETSLTEMGMTMNYRYFDDGGTGNVDVNSGRIEVDFSRLYDSPSLGSTLAGLAELSLSDFVPTDLWAQGSGSIRYYFDEEGAWYAFGGAEGSASLEALGLDIRAGGGYGRFTDVTPMAKALLIEEKLTELGALDGPLSDELLMSVARTIGSAIEYESTRDLVETIEADVEAEVGASLGAQELLWIEQIVERPGDMRKCGWTVQAGLGYEVIDSEGGEHDLLLALGADAAWPITARDQMVLHARISGPVTLTQQSTVNVSAVYDHELSEDVTMGFRFAWRRIDPEAGAVTSTWSISSSISYALPRGGVGLQASIRRKAGDDRWTTEISVSASVDLL